jgi:hypothetical protein
MTTQPAEQKRVSLAAAGLAAGVLASRLPWLPGALVDHDAVNFARGLSDFDLAAHSPHFPGYPVFMALARLAHLAGLPEAAALALPGMLAAALAAAALFVVVQRRSGTPAAWVAAGIYATLPGPWLADMTPLSDSLGLHGLTLVLLATVYGGARARIVAGAGVGLLLGVRLSWAPLLAPLGLLALWRAERAWERGAQLAAGATALALWLVPLTVAAGGPAALLELALTFTAGHMETWGNTALSTGAAGPGDRLTAMAWNFFVHATGVGALLLIPLAATRGSARGDWTLLTLAVPYLLWILLAQNPDKPRHVLPLVPLLVLIAAPGAATWAARLGRYRGALALAPALVLAATAPRLATVATELPAPLQAVRWVTAHHGPEHLQIYAGDDAGLWRWYAPAWRSVMVRGADDIERDARERGNTPGTVLVTSRAGDLATLSPQLEVAARFDRSPLVDGARHELTVYRWTAPPEAEGER